LKRNRNAGTIGLAQYGSLKWGSALITRADTRLAPRRNTSIPALIVFDGGRRRMNCIIRNLSDRGAKLEVEKVVGVPNSFDLFARGIDPHACRVVWRALRELGVQFAD